MRCRSSQNFWLAGLGLVVVGVGGLTRADSEDTVTALGRLEPRGGPVRVAGPSVPVAVIAVLDVEEGQTVTEGQVIARLDAYRARRWCANRGGARASAAELRGKDSRVRARRSAVAARGRGSAVRAARRVSTPRATRSRSRSATRQSRGASSRCTRVGRARGAEGVSSSAAPEMFAVEVYETDIGRVKAGQRATITSPALPKPISGAVEKVGLKIGRLDAVGADPVAKTDARVVEVEIRLEDPAAVANLTNLQVEVQIVP